MGKKLLFFDVDETLMDGRTQRVPDSAIEGIRKAHEKGNLIFINTGRCKSLMPACLEEIPIDGYSYSCGSHIEYEGETLFEKFVPMEDIVRIREAMEASDIQGIFQGPEYCYFCDEAKGHLEGGPAGGRCYENFRRFLRMYEKDYKAEKKTYDETEMQVNKLISFWVDSCDYKGFLERIKQCQIIENGGGFTEILPLSYTKATGIDFLLDYFQIPEEDCYVFGDSPNDFPMLLRLKNSIVMGNGYQEVKDVAGYVTDDIDKDGIYKALKHFSII